MTHERRVFVPLSSPVQGSEIELDERDAHHLRSVVRMEAGDPLTVVDTVTNTAYASFVSAPGKPFVVKLGKPEVGGPESHHVGVLLFALCKNRTNDLVAEKATELGVQHIIFWQAERSVVRYSSNDEREKRAERLRKIAVEAAKQSSRSSVPSVTVASALMNALDSLGRLSAENDRFFFGSLSPSAKPLTRLPRLEGRAHVLIGPEGDLTRSEEDTLVSRGFEPFTLGENRLRAETAACAAITAIDIFGSIAS